MADAAAGATPCQILDDEELERQSRFRGWRRDPATPAAGTRIFGGGPGPLAGAPTSGSGFPSAFQTYRSSGGAGAPPSTPGAGPKIFPFQVQKKRSAGAPAPAPPTKPKQPTGGEPGTLVANVLSTFQVDPLITEITEKGFHLLDIHTGDEKRCDPPYAACTPPQCHSPKTPPIFDEGAK